MDTVVFNLCEFCTVGENGEVKCSAPREAIPPSLPKCKNFANCRKPAYIDASGKVHDLCRRACLHVKKQEKPLQCPVFGCFDNHSQHFCKNCKNDNSDHKSDNCPKKSCKHCSMELKFHNGNLCLGRKNTKFE